jgi:hypothetical protein
LEIVLQRTELLAKNKQTAVINFVAIFAHEERIKSAGKNRRRGPLIV